MKITLLFGLFIVGIFSATCPTYDCGCSWATESACGTNDGSNCYAQCCCEAGFYDPGNDTSTGVQTGWETGTTTRYWDCCKPSCTWSDNVVGLADGYTTVRSCQLDGSDANPDGVNICIGGGGSSDIAYSCVDNQPWYDAENDVMFGFVAKNSKSCCQCVELEFTSTALAGKTMVVQVTNSGDDLGQAHFDIQLPGGGFGLFNGCTNTSSEPANGDPQFPEKEDVWGERYGGVSDISACDAFPEALKPGCLFRFNNFLNADNPTVNWRRVQCPTVLTDITGCVLNDDADYPVYGSTSSTEAANTDVSSSSNNDSASDQSVNDQTTNTDIDSSNEETENKTILVLLSLLLLVSILTV